MLRWSDELRSSVVHSADHEHARWRKKQKTRRTKLRRNQGEVQQEHDEEKSIQISEPDQGQQEPKRDKSLLSRGNADD